MSTIMRIEKKNLNRGKNGNRSPLSARGEGSGVRFQIPARTATTPRLSASSLPSASALSALKSPPCLSVSSVFSVVNVPRFPAESATAIGK